MNRAFSAGVSVFLRNPDASRQAKIEYSAFGATQNTLLNLGRGPEFCESEGPTSVDNTIPSGVRHALP
jgi:hypothetical protein